MESQTMSALLAACELAEIPIYEPDFLCRTLAILHCYGGGPGSEHFRAPVGYVVAMKASKMLDEAIRRRNFAIVKKFQSYVRELQANDAPWLERTLDKLNIPPKEIKFGECIQRQSPKGT